MKLSAKLLMLSALVACVGTAQPVFAHLTGVNHSHSDFGAGLAHPFSGLDHVLAMVAIGIWGMQRGGKMAWLLPVTFVVAMLAGGALAMAGVGIPFVEPGIAASIFVLGLLIAAAVKTPSAAAVGLAALFAIFHGHAHGAELPVGGGGAAYALGFAVATATLHAVGIAVALSVGAIWRQDSTRAFALRVAGGAIIAAGFVAVF